MLIRILLITLISFISTSLFATPRFATPESIQNFNPDAKVAAAQHGMGALTGNNVTNEGMIEVKFANMVVAAENKQTIDFRGDQLINFTVTSSNQKDENVSNNKKSINGTTASKVLDNEINMAGIAEAKFVAQRNGEIIFVAKQ